MKIRPVGAEFFRANGRKDRQTDRLTNKDDKAHRPFLQFCESVSKLRKKANFLICVKELLLYPSLLRSSCYKLLCCSTP